MLLKTQVSLYLSWKAVQGTFVYKYKKGGMFSKESHKVCKVPSTVSEATSSPLMGLIQKTYCGKQLAWVQDFDINDCMFY